MRRGRLEIATVGFNPNLQLVGSDPSGGPYDLGIFIGANAGSTKPTLRQLYMLCMKSFNAGQRGRLIGFREYLTLLVQETSPTAGATYPLERPVETPTWKYVDGNVLWGIRCLPPKTHFRPNALNADGLAFEQSQTPAQLFETIGGGIITPPYGGLFPGNVLTPDLGSMRELRCRRWADYIPCDVYFEGPCDIAFFASVQQTNPSTRTAPPVIGTTPIPVSAQFNGGSGLPDNTLVEHWYVVTTTGVNASIGDLLFDNGSNAGVVTVIPPTVGESIIPSTNFTGGTISLNAGQVYVWNGSTWQASSTSPAPGQFLITQGTTPEDAFVQNYPGSTYGRIAGALIFEMEEQAPTGAPKTYRRPGDADRITRDTTETGDNTMRRSAEDTSEYKRAWDSQSTVKRPASPPHANQLGKMLEALEGLHADALVGVGQIATVGLGETPKGSSDPTVRAIAARWRGGQKAKKAAEKIEAKVGLGNLPGFVGNTPISTGSSQGGVGNLPNAGSLPSGSLRGGEDTLRRIAKNRDLFWRGGGR